jgi:hypothetical protein
MPTVSSNSAHDDHGSNKGQSPTLPDAPTQTGGSLTVSPTAPSAPTLETLTAPTPTAPSALCYNTDIALCSNTTATCCNPIGSNTNSLINNSIHSSHVDCLNQQQGAGCPRSGSDNSTNTDPQHQWNLYYNADCNKKVNISNNLTDRPTDRQKNDKNHG